MKEMRRLFCTFGGLAFAGAAGVLATVALLRLTAPEPLPPQRSVEVVDRNGALLRPFALPDGRWRLAAGPADVDRRYLRMLTVFEDRRFERHYGVDPLAMLRASWQLLRHGEIVSGGSTLTMQVARLLEPRTERTLAAKFREMLRAIRLEARLSKDEILSLYLTLAPFGGNLEGLRAASHAYFGKEPVRLSLGEAALLVALPQSPELRRPDRAPEAALRARNRVLDRMLDAGVITPAEADHARAEPMPKGRREMPQLAPHLAEAAVAAAPVMHRHRLSIDAILQRRLEDLARERVAAFGPQLSIAMIAVDHRTGEVLARVGAADFNDLSRLGRIDMTRAVRSPGSALKPFIYGLAFEDGIAHPETLLEDRPTRFGAWRPENFDLSYQGTITARRALQLSLNVPAVALLDAAGPQRLFTRLAASGARLELPEGEVPGLAISLGGVGIRLDDLAMLYAALARGGEAVPLVQHLDQPPSPRRARVLDPVAAWYVGSALSGTPPPEHAGAGRVAYKTGTSYGYRDAWAAGFDGERTIAVWVGRPDGQPVPGLTGRSAAAPLLFDAFARFPMRATPLPPPPAGALIASTARLPRPLQRFSTAGELHLVNPAPPLRIVFPPNGAQLALETPAPAATPEAIVVKTTGGTGPYRILVDGRPLPDTVLRGPLFWTPEGPGFVRLTVVDARGNTDSVTVRLQR
jgi:penicillin-binding protein 1C